MGLLGYIGGMDYLHVLPGRRLQAVHEVRELDGVADEEHRDVVADLQ